MGTFKMGRLSVQAEVNECAFCRAVRQAHGPEFYRRAPHDPARWAAPILGWGTRVFLGVIFVVNSVSAIENQRQPLPAGIDLQPEFQLLGILPGTQGERDVCSLFAITAAANFEFSRLVPGPHGRFSEEFLIWAAKEATGKEGEQAMFYEAVQGLNTFGICTEDLMPYMNKSEAHRKPSPQALSEAKKRCARWNVHWIKRWDLKNPLSEQELMAIKRALANSHPVACGLRWPKQKNPALLLEVPPPHAVGLATSRR